GRGRALGPPRSGRRGDAARPVGRPHRFRSSRTDDRGDARRDRAVAAAVRVIEEQRFDALTVRVAGDTREMAHDAADAAAHALRSALDAHGEVNVMLATGNSQLAFLDELMQRSGIAWDRIRAFHMD